jgi:hypothetical protein
VTFAKDTDLALALPRIGESATLEPALSSRAW